MDKQIMPMDKQIMGISGEGTQQGGDLLGLLNQGDGHRSNSAGAGVGVGAGLREEILPSYDFIRRAGSPPPHVGVDGGGAWGSEGPKPSASDFRNYGSLEAQEPPKVILEKSKDTFDAAAASVTEIDRIVKKYADILLHNLEGVSSRLSQLEGRTRILENVVDDLKLSIDESSDNADRKLRQLENVLREVQTGVRVLCDKQEITEAKMQLAKLQASKGDHQPLDNSNTILSDSQQPHMPLPPQALQQPAQPSAALPPALQIPALPLPAAPNALPPPLPPQQNPPPSQLSSQASQHQVSSIPQMLPREPYFPSPGQPPAEAHQQHYQLPPPQQTQVPLPQHYQPPPQQTQMPLPQHYQPPPQLARYSQPPQQTQAAGPPQLQSSLPHHPEESSPYMPPSQTYPPSIHQPPPLQTGPPPPQQIYGSTANIYEPPTSRPVPGQQPFPTGYGPSSGLSFPDSYPYGGSSSPYSSAREPSPFSPSSAPSTGSTYPRLPSAQILPQALPTASGPSGSAGNRVPVDDVVDKVTTMGFPRDLVRATVRKLTENGQSVDLNTVLDKVMNDNENQPRKGWFGR